MPTVFLSPIPAPGSPLFIPGGNAPVSGGLLFQYATGTSNKLNTYTTSSGAVANANPIVLDSGGNLTGSREVWLIQSSSYRFVLAPSNDQDPPLSPYWTLDSISGINDINNQLTVAGAEWVLSANTPSFANASSFVIGGDQTSVFTVGRRVKTTNTGGTIYGTVTSSVFSTSTTVFVVPDSGGLDSGLNAVSYGLLSTPNGSIPWTNVSSSGLTISSATFSSLVAASVTTVVLHVGSSSPAIFGEVIKRKTADETLSGTTVLHNDAHLFFPVGANDEWLIDFYVNTNDNAASSAAGLKLSVNVPSGATTAVQASVISGTATSTIINATMIRTSSTNGVLDFNPTILNNTSASDYSVEVHAWVLNTSTAGNIQLQWSPSSSNATTLKVYKGSAMEAYRVA